MMDFGADGTATDIRHFRIEQEDHPIEYKSLEDMLATFAAAYELGVFFVDSAGFLDVDDDAYASIAEVHNPDVAWWGA